MGSIFIFEIPDWQLPYWYNVAKLSIQQTIKINPSSHFEAVHPKIQQNRTFSDVSWPPHSSQLLEGHYNYNIALWHNSISLTMITNITQITSVLSALIMGVQIKKEHRTPNSGTTLKNLTNHSQYQQWTISPKRKKWNNPKKFHNLHFAKAKFTK